MARDEKRRKSSKKHKKKKSRRRYDSDSDASSRSNSSSSEDDRRVVKKQRKQAEKVLASFGYTNETNPFGDSNLTQPFVWRKKYEGGSDASDDDDDKHKKKKKKASRPSEKELKRNQLARVEEIRKARQRREEREREQEEKERLRQEEMRLRDAEQYEDWQQKEEEFHRTQTKVRSKLRIQQRREKPVDLLAKNLLLADHAMQEDEEDDFYRRGVRVETRRPHAIVEVLSMDELEDLREDIRAYLDLEESRNTGKTNKEFWDLMMVVTRDRIRRLRRSQSEASEDVRGRERGAIHDSVNDTIEEMLSGKNTSELDKLKDEVEATIESAATTPGVDVEFWEEVAQQIGVYKARARLTELHDDMLDKLKDLIKQHDTAAASQGDRDRERERSHRDRDPSDLRDDSAEARALEHQEAEKGLEESEEKLGTADEVALEGKLPSWSDKYQPRKPRYFNRVKTGYDWNKYNQTHYDHDNPPPKVVQGYKFNLFYPDLIDKTAAPRFVLEKSNSSEFCIIRFTAGPPYQDIAFKIVNREWEYSHKRGFKSVFERGILHLYFNFKRHRYRR
ncbi:hypothetical protein Poli38472_009648 [Pythium oligandrum]|uniref:Splicing factor Cactin n=1 Tax=Pythium oligandrum TaxID=41045 RepID=A0A8K1CFB0_PYTOL|nr:hypothetical protein Poli38472_009648 [Pythium oligandrum]|eukprot:TMW62155.1 hypothetical protein Poli38472_009648 [Pythium oligandrum]